MRAAAADHPVRSSFTRPPAAGGVAPAYAAKPDASHDEVYDAVLGGADPVGALAGNVSTGGRLNAFDTLRLLKGTMPDMISGTVFDDADGDGVRDPGEQGASGRTVYLDLDGDGALDRTTATRASAPAAPVSDWGTITVEMPVAAARPNRRPRRNAGTRGGRTWSSRWSRRGASGWN